MPSDLMFIAEFQLQSLIQNQVQFLYFDLSDDSNDFAINHSLLKSASKISKSLIFEKIGQVAMDKMQPIILVCEDGSTSSEIGRILIQDEYVNVHVLESGFQSLRELT